MRQQWTRSHPSAVTDRLRAVVPDPRRPRTLRLPRVREAILRDTVDQVAADQLDAMLAGRRAVDAGAALADAVLRGRLVPRPVWEHTVLAAARALTHAHQQLRPLAQRAEHAMTAKAARCEHCSAAELCARHQHVLWAWMDVRDRHAIAAVNTTVAALTAQRRLSSARRRSAT